MNLIMAIQNTFEIIFNLFRLSIKHKKLKNKTTVTIFINCSISIIPLNFIAFKLAVHISFKSSLSEAYFHVNIYQFAQCTPMYQYQYNL